MISDYDKAVDTFAWPQLTGTFNWATDWFDVIARRQRPTGSRCGSSSRTAASRRSASPRWPTAPTGWRRGCAGLGVGKGDRVILMLGNQVELWEAMLAVAKLGAVIMPTTGALGPADLADRDQPRRRARS